MNVSDQFWAKILEFQKTCREAPDEHSDVLWTVDDFHVCDGAPDRYAEESGVLVCRNDVHVRGWERFEVFENRLWLHRSPHCDTTLFNAVRLYVPLCLAPRIKPSESFVIVHMAQSVDGNVATTQGNSKWIGNKENLTHAHRLRALVDGVIVGGETARVDAPRLNVRHVQGTNPARILFSDSLTDVAELPGVEEMRTILLRSTEIGGGTTRINGSETLWYQRAGKGKQVDVKGILGSLRECGIQSILLEGGPTTFHTFFSAGAIDWVQFHIAPMIMGPGKSILPLAEIVELKDAVQIRNPFYVAMGDAIMTTGQL